MTMRMRIVTAAAAAMFLIPRIEGGQAQYHVEAIAGDVKIISGGVTRHAAVDQALIGGDVIMTGGSSMADISWGDRGLVRVEEKTRVAVSALAKKADDPDLDMSAGSIMIMLSNLVRGETYRVKTHTQIASVRGTSFRVSADDDLSRVDVLTGSIMVHPVLAGAVIREIGEAVTEDHSVSMNRSLVKEIVARRVKISVLMLQKRDLDGLADRFDSMQKSRGFKRLNARIRNEIGERIKRHRERLRDGGKRRPGRKPQDGGMRRPRPGR
ncbi:MAG: FecR domain-containing protein [Spirochaetes bacterium]|nr:FecR domain-containing protein [Spirochaetota bacterium]